MADEKNPDEKNHTISSVAPGLVDELNLVPLDERVELSPVGVLDVLVANIDVIDAANDEEADGKNCPVDNTCGSKDNCVGQGNCGGRNNCGADGKCGSKGSGAYDE